MLRVALVICFRAQTGDSFCKKGKGDSVDFTMTRSAEEKVEELLGFESVNDVFHTGKGMEKGLRVAVRAGGCSGFMYEMTFELPEPEDIKIAGMFSSITVLIDPESAVLLNGTVLDYKESLQGGTGFKFENPNSVRKCGCGQSFS
jgi:iron-sulfur cluster assembly accessory protein